MPPTLDTDGALFARLRPRLIAISRRIVGSEADAQDIVQDCYLKWQQAERSSLSAPAAWLTTVVQHQSIDRLRKRARDDVAERTLGELMSDTPAPSPEQGLLRSAELGEALARMLASLSPSERLALVLHEVFECGHVDIATVLGTRAVNARQHLARARRRLRSVSDEARVDEKLCRDLVRRFQAAINDLDVPAMIMLLGADQPVSVCESPQAHLGAGACANDAFYRCSLAA